MSEAVVDTLVIDIETRMGEALSGLKRLTEGFKKITAPIQKTASALGNVGKSSKKTSKGVGLLGVKFRFLSGSLARIAKYRFIRFMLSQITQAAKEGINNLALYSKSINGLDSAKANQTLSAIKTKFLEVKNALGAAVMPVLQALTPLIIAVANAFIAAANAANQFISILQGKSTFTKAKEYAVDYADSLTSAGEAAKKLKDYTMGFDELNIINTDTASGSGGGQSQDYSQMFEEAKIDTGVMDALDGILQKVKLIGAALLAWKINGALGGNLLTFLELAGAIYAILDAIQNYIDMWQNGITGDSLGNFLRDIALAAGLLFLAFQQLVPALAPIVAGFVFFAGGIALIVLAIKDFNENGATFLNTLTMIAGILSTGLGLTLITGSLIPLAIAGISALIYAIMAVTGNLDRFFDGLKQMWDGIKEMLSGIIHGDLEEFMHGFENVFGGLTKIVDTILKSVQDLFIMALEWLANTFGLDLDNVINAVNKVFWTVRKTVAEVIYAVKLIFQGIIDFIAGVFSGDWDKALHGVAEIFTGIFGGIAVTIRGVVNTAIDLVEGFLNIILDALNGVLDKIWSTFSGAVNVVAEFIGSDFELPESIEWKVSLPRLADGGTVDTGQLFIANEAGPELVGKVGNKTTVTNQDQFTQGLAEANENVVNAIIAMAEAVVSAIDKKDVNTYLDGEALYRNQQKVKRTAGYNFDMGAFTR